MDSIYLFCAFLQDEHIYIIIKDVIEVKKEFSKDMESLIFVLRKLGGNMFVLESPLKIKNLELKNRLIFPPMGTGIANADGSVNEKLIRYYDDRAHGGYLSLIIVEHSFISQQGKASENQLSVANDSTISGLEKIAKTIQKNGVKAVLQLNHAGAATSKSITGEETVSASALANRNGREISHPLSESEIKKVISDFANAAERAKKPDLTALRFTPRIVIC